MHVLANCFIMHSSTDVTGDVDAHKVDDTNANKDVSSLQGIYAIMFDMHMSWLNCRKQCCK